MLLREGGMFNIEVHDGDVLVAEAQFDTIYHEHLTYFTETTLRYFAEIQGFEFIECQRTSMHGGGLRFSCRLRSTETSSHPPIADPTRIDAVGLTETIGRCRTDVERLYAEYGPIDGYGAAGRAQMFIGMTGTARYFAQVFDDSHFRQGRYIVGTDVPIRKYGLSRSRCCVILAWNYAPSIARRIESDYFRVLTLLPELRVWNG